MNPRVREVIPTDNYQLMLYQLCMKTFLPILLYTRPFKRIQDKLPVDNRLERGIARAFKDGMDAMPQVAGRFNYLPFRPCPDLLYRVSNSRSIF